MLKLSLCASFFCAGAAVFAAPVQAAGTPASAPSAQASSPPAYADFVKDAQVFPGLIPIVKKQGKVYLALAKSQLATDFIETSVPSTGLGGYGPAPGEPYVAPARILRFDRVDDQVVIRWPNTYARVMPNTAQDFDTQQSMPASVIAVVPVAAQDDNTVVIPATPFLSDVANFSAAFDNIIANPMHGYHLDPERSIFEVAKAFPENDVLRVSQTWTAEKPNLIDSSPDARNIEVQMTYNLIMPPHDGYMPRIADPRVGYFEQGLLDFTTDNIETRNVQYIARWNFAPQDPSRPSNATHPIVYYLSNTIPQEYRKTVRDALLTWNKAFARVGILNAIQVEDQPADPTWDPEDIRHNVVRWVANVQPLYGAEALIVTDPRTGEEINVGVNVDATGGAASGFVYRFLIAPARGLPDTLAEENEFNQELERAVVLHESGHDMGLQHNFMGSLAYDAAQLQSKAFTDRYGIASSVMEYTPIANLWPKGTRNGDYEQTTLGPYDYYAIRYGYGHVAGAKTPEAEISTLRRWASSWSSPTHSFASDEDAGSFFNGHSIDPRIEMFDLTNEPLAWCGTQLKMWHGVMDAVNARFPWRGRPFDEARMAFVMPLSQYTLCATRPADTIGAEYLSRNAGGDPNAEAPLAAVPYGTERQAWQLLDRWLFSDAAWRFNPNVLTRLTYSEMSSTTNNQSWFYNPPPRHDVPVVEIAAQTQDRALRELFSPLTLERIDDLQTKYARHSTMNIADLFTWAQAGIFGELAGPREMQDGVVRRNLQMRFVKQLGMIWTAPERGTPTDAQALARLTLTQVVHDGNVALASKRLDLLTRAHVEAMVAVAKRALEANSTIAAPLENADQGAAMRNSWCGGLCCHWPVWRPCL
jgi:hypothetical protein